MTATLRPEVATLGLAVGLMFALVCYLVANLSPGGMISPGWLALTLVQDWRQFLAVLAAVLATWGGAVLLQRWVILFGRRLLAATVLLGVLLTTGAFLAVQNTVPLLFAHQTLGFIVPGLVAYQLVKQPVLPTALATSGVTAASYGVLASGLLAGVLPAL
jgi:poly-gamma-glutamate biosynthesis protein PgsC/CapC